MKRNIKWFSSAMLGLALAGSVRADTTNLVMDITGDDPNNIEWSFSYHYVNNGWGAAPGHSDWPGGNEMFGFDLEAPDYTNALYKLTFDSTFISDFTNHLTGVDDWSYGFGAGGKFRPVVDYTLLKGTNREDYILEFDAKVEGLMEGTSAGNGEFQLKFIQGGTNTLVQHNYSFSTGTNWTHFRYGLDQGSANSADWDNFVANRASVDSLQFGYNWHEPSRQFGFDSDNVILLDNLRLSAIDRLPIPAPPTVAHTVLLWDMDATALYYSWGGSAWSGNGINAAFTAISAVAGAGVGGGNAFEMACDNSPYATNQPPWAGGQVGLGGPGNYANMMTSDLNLYVLSMDVRAEGMAPDTTTTSFDVQVFIRAPDGTLSVTNGATDMLVQMNGTVSGVTSNYTTKSLIVGKLGLGGGTKETFAAYFKQVSEVTLQLQLNNIAGATPWGQDANNKVFLDNIKLESLVIGNPQLTITTSGANALVTWPAPNTGTCKLQTTTTPWNAASWADITGAANPYSTPIAGAPKYFRTKWIPPF
jgi:hypothetical protein